MDKELIEKIEELAQGRAYYVTRMVGNRAEVHFSGAQYPVSIRFGDPKVSDQALKKMSIADLRRLASDLEIIVYGLKKAELIAAIKEKES